MSNKNPKDKSSSQKAVAILSYVTCVASLIGGIWVSNTTHNPQVIAPCVILFLCSLTSSLFFLLKDVPLSDNPYNDNDLY